MRIVLFENNAPSFLPLTHLQASFDLRCGMFTAWERIARRYPDAQLLPLVRGQLADVMTERKGVAANARPDGPALFLSGAALFDAAGLARLAEFAESDAAFISEDGAVSGYSAASPKWRDAVFDALSSGELIPPEHAPARVGIQSALLCRPWDLIARNAEQLAVDAAMFPLGRIHETASVAETARLLRSDNVHVGARARIGEGAVLDATEGPVVVDDGAWVMHQAVVIGPAYIGRESTVKIAARIYEGASVGPVCKVGGEIEGAIFHSYSNKQHEGFAGHSYFGPWTNIGADSNTSDLKNTYKQVRMTLEGTEYNTGLTLLGTVMADHAKCGINSMLTTGTSVGVGANLFGAGYFPAYAPSFAWGGAGGFREYRFEMCAAVAETVMARRGCALTSAERSLLRLVFDMTAYQRDAWRNA